MILRPFSLHLIPPHPLPVPPPRPPPGYGWEGDGGQSPRCRTPDSLIVAPHSAPGEAGFPLPMRGGG